MAEWIEIKNTPYSYITVCSECKYPKTIKSDSKCINCGAVMNEVKDGKNNNKID